LSASAVHKAPPYAHAGAPKNRLQFTLPKPNLAAYLTSAALIAAATLVSSAAFNLVPEASLSLIYLVAIMISAQLYGLWPAILSSLLGILAWDFFFTKPYFELAISSEQDVFTLIFFMITALIMSGVTSLVRRQNRDLTLFARRKQDLYNFTNELATIDSVEEIASFAARYCAGLLCRDVSVALYDRNIPGGTRVFSGGETVGETLTDLDLSAGILLAQFPQSSVTRNAKFLPLVGLRGPVGAIKIGGTLAQQLSNADEEQLSAPLSQVAVAIERIWLSEEHRSASLTAENERMRNALLLSVSHDLRTPLTTIIGSLSTMALPQLEGKDSSRRELASIALTEAQRLDRFIANLLDMTKLEFGNLKAPLSAVNIEDVVASVIERAHLLLLSHHVSVVIQKDIPLIDANFDLLEQAIFNLVDNAAKYCLPPANIEIRAFQDYGSVVIQVMDQGHGISEQLAPILFQKFARASTGDKEQSGTGLGLAITKGFIEAMGGSVTAENRSDQQGAIFIIRLPAARDGPANPSHDTATFQVFP
jgi:two-component system, OmpR family, sensor histidine kinase KdpD